MTVKGSKAYEWRVQKHQPHLKMVVSVVFTVMLLVTAASMFYFGYRLGAAGEEEAELALASAQKKLDSIIDGRQDLEQALENVKLGGQVDRQSLEAVRKEVLELRSNIAALEEDNQFYRNLMAPTKNKRGLNFGTIELSASEAPRTYAFKVVVQQLAVSHQVLKGSMTFTIVGRDSNGVKVYALADLSKTVEAVNIKLRFKYFQTVEGEIVLPEGFEPEKIELVARSTGSKPTNIEKRLAWLVQES